MGKCEGIDRDSEKRERYGEIKRKRKCDGIDRDSEADKIIWYNIKRSDVRKKVEI